MNINLIVLAAAVLIVASASRISTAGAAWRRSADALAFLLLSALFLWREASPLFDRMTADVGPGEMALRAGGALWWFLAARLTVSALRFAVRHDLRSRQTRLVSDLAAAGVYIAAGFAVLNSVLDLPIGGLLATSGVIAVVIGLALQSTLADVFAGIAVGLEAPFRVGDRVRLDDRFEGLVIEANWRSIRLQTDDDDVVVIPNSRVAKAEIVNRSSPTLRRAASVDVPCPATAAPEQICQLLAEATLLCPAILAEPAPHVSLRRLGVRTNLFRISFTVGETSHLSSTRSLLLRQVHRQLHHAGLIEGGEPDDAGVTRQGGDLRDPGARLLAETSLFADLDPQAIADLAADLQLRTLEPDERLFEEADVDATLYLIASGVFSIERRDDPEPIGRVGAGDYIGEVSLLTGAPHAASARALTHARVYQLAGDTLAPLLARRPELADRFDRSCRKGLALLQRTVASQASPSVGGPGELLARIRRFLTSEAGR